MTLLHIGELARRAGLRPSALRYYETEGLLHPAQRTASGYRLYAPETLQTLQLIQRAQRLGFSLADMRALLQAEQRGVLDDEAVLEVAQARYLALERQVTELLVQRHELEHFLQDLSQAHTHPAGTASIIAEHLLERVCPAPLEPLSPDITLDWLIRRTGCSLTNDDVAHLLAALRGQHSHIWQVEDGYHILITGRQPGVEAALGELVEAEAGCQVHSRPQLEHTPEGYLLTVSGDYAFVFARFFLSLEAAPGQPI